MAETTEAPVENNPYTKPAYRTYVLMVLTLVYSFNFIDRQLISILQESIKAELLLSDTQLGLLTGFAFALFYVSAGVPIARWADRGNRRNIISLAVGVWSFMTAISGACMNYTQLLLARIGVGVGEAGGSPPAHSMISDIFPPESRATAMSTYSLGINIGIMFGFFLGGILNEVLGWRWAFVLVGAPGILLAIWIRMTVAEPLRGWSEQAAVEETAVPLKDVVKRIYANLALRHLFFASALNSLVGYGLVNWTAPFYIRSHGMGTAELGIWLAIGAGIFGGVGTFLAGYYADKLGKIDRRWYLLLPGIAVLAMVPFCVAFLLAENTTAALSINLIPSLLSTCYIGPCLALTHGMVEPRMRATASALYFLVINIIGLGLGPTLIGALSDYLAPELGSESLRHAMLYIIPATAAWASLHFFIGSKHLRDK
ncbi:MFS transporter [Halioglobus japonicus]|uniref:MFS transporter n=1 Tax=Halioglobus japonicus TaxID=930805 RepID=A0AAP8MH47_9GAMM|nr:MFS transporter [Halioglobus japonicus]AQA19231.1 MFS transporter [Halioglobus japonicus]PLW87733.1 MFS transporter [Halioglobus japonicus]GHD06882.1 MFS transporter [Halioglobus japonicus]